MANELIRPSALPPRANPVATEVVPSDNGSEVAAVTWADGVNAGRPLANQSEAEGGVQATKAMTPLTTKQAITAQVPTIVSGAIGALNLGTMSQEDATDYTPTSGLAAVALSNDYGGLDNLPTLGTAAATDASDYAVAARGLPTGGSVGQILAKSSGADYAVTWVGVGAGDMEASTYDPTSKSRDIFAFVNDGGGTYITSWQLGLANDGSDAAGNDSKLQSWINGLSDTGHILFGVGKFAFNSEKVFDFASSATGPSDDKKTFGRFVVDGFGPDLTTLYFPDSHGLKFTAHSFQQTVGIHRLSITTGGEGDYTAISIECDFGFFGSYTAQHDITEVTCRGDDGYGATFYWDRSLDLYNITSVNVDRCSLYGPVASAATDGSGSAYGVGVYIDAPTPSLEGSATTYNFTNNNFVFLGRSVYVGTDVQAFSFGPGNHILNGCDGIYVASGGVEVRQLNVIGTEISVNGNAIHLGSAVPASIFANNYIAVNTSKNGIVFANATGAANSMGSVVTGNVFVGKDVGASDGIYINCEYAPISVTGNTFLGLNTGIELTANAGKVTVVGNRFLNCNNEVIEGNDNRSNFVADGPWKSFTPTVTAGSGTFTSVSAAGAYKRVSRTVTFRMRITITTNGSAATYVQATLPVSAASASAACGRETTVTGNSASVILSGGNAFITKYDGTYLGGNGYQIDVSGSYEGPA